MQAQDLVLATQPYPCRTLAEGNGGTLPEGEGEAHSAPVEEPMPAMELPTAGGLAALQDLATLC